jgi:hypothetical protein
MSKADVWKAAAERAARHLAMEDGEAIEKAIVSEPETKVVPQTTIRVKLVLKDDNEECYEYLPDLSAIRKVPC